MNKNYKTNLFPLYVNGTNSKPNSYFVKPHSKVFRTIKGNKFLINNLIVINLF